MAVIFDFGVQGAQMLLVLLLAPLLTGFTRKVKARLLLRRGPPLVQPYRDLVRLMRKEVVLADNASWLFRVNPYLIFAATWVAGFFSSARPEPTRPMTGSAFMARCSPSAATR